MQGTKAHNFHPGQVNVKNPLTGRVDCANLVGDSVTGWFLDTIILSELRRPRPEPKVVAFVATLTGHQRCNGATPWPDSGRGIPVTM